MPAVDRYDFQRQAADAIVHDFRETPQGRFLLVIPTGGGKTRTAVRSLHALFDNKVLDPEQDRVMWVVHRDELITQAKEAFDDFEKDEPNITPRQDRVDFLMLGKVREFLDAHPEARFAVIDEAHHGAANSYQPMFARTSMAILGLTATPSRNDGRPLQFTRESFSIGFPDLVDLGVLIRPEVVTIEGGTYDIDNINDDDALEVLNNDERNHRILATLNERSATLHKVVLYVGTIKHAQDLYALLKASPLAAEYECIALITGKERKRYVASQGKEFGEERQVFVKNLKAASRAIVVNVDVLLEGYDDPAINAVVMARPTRSKLVYMQAIGRAVRVDKRNPEKQAFILEIADVLPNVRYRIDNRWLFSDVTDVLEPDIVDAEYKHFDALPTLITEVFERYGVPPELRGLPAITSSDRVTVLMFRVYSGDGAFFHIPIVITNETRRAAASFFNFLAMRMGTFTGLDPEQVFSPVRAHSDMFPALATPRNRRYVMQAMENAWQLTPAQVAKKPNPALLPGAPWITFVSFRLRRDTESLGADLLAFTEDMLNRDAIRETLTTGAYTSGFFLVKLPLPLRGSWGKLLSPSEFVSIDSTIAELRTHVDDADGVSQWHAAITILGSATLPVEHRHHQSLTTIIRENMDYFRELQR